MRLVRPSFLTFPFCILLAQATSGATLKEKLSPIINAHEGKVAVAVKHLKTGETFLHNETVPMPTASLIKFPVMIEAYRQASEGKIKLDDKVTLQESDKVPGSGILTTHFSPGATISVRDAIRLMIVYSDNTATNLVVDQIGLKSVSDVMTTLGAPNTKIHAKVFRRDTSIFPERSNQFGLGSTTAAEMIKLFELLERRELVNKEASEAMFGHLLLCEDQAKFRRFLPPGTKVAHKTGSVTAVRTDAGIVYSPTGPIALAVLTNENKDKSGGDDNAGNRLCAEVARIVFQHFNPKPNPTGDIATAPLEIGASGELVEALQRTLNQRLSPTPGISVDGDFGSQTQAAVIAFQKFKDLEPTGIVDAKTWQALGPIITSEAPPPDPKTINSEKLSKAAADPLSGPPFVTCKAWAIADGKSGEMLWNENGDKPLDIASTTKVMTAYLVLRATRDSPDSLSEIVTFSKRADDTVGSTADVRAGEKLSVAELLYGLMLPSGNDAAVALGEHFGSRFQARGGNGSDDSLVRFVDEMNRTAATLKMKQTRYENPHGLTAGSHKSTAADLVRLAHAAWQNERFRHYTQTRQRGCTVEGASGYRRNIVWKNTNTLLSIDGYQGIKTGTTTAAGACLVSYGERNSDSLFIVVLGSTSSDARYTDTRNLFRWAWNQRGHKS